MPRSDERLDDRVVLVTGASGGLGGAVSRAAALAGAELVLCGRDQKKLEALYDDIAAGGGPRPALFPIDFGSAAPEDYRRLADGIEADCGRLDGILHLAGAFGGLSPLASTPLETWQRTLHTNLTAPFAVTQACLPLLQAAEDATVVFATDRRGRSRDTFWGPYAAAKAALAVLTAQFAAESGGESLRVNALDPGPLATPLRGRAYPGGDPAARPPAEVAAAFVHLLGPAGRAFNGRVLDIEELGSAN